MRVALTGATGLLGSNLTRLLCASKHEVICTQRASSKTDYLKDLPVRWIVADLDDLDALVRAFEGVEVVFHCAALVGYGPVIDRVMEKTNVLGTRNVLDAVRAARVSRLLHCSSVDALGLPDGELSADETQAWNWDRYGVNFGYPRTKYQGEQLVLQATDINSVIVNPTFLIGPYDPKPSSGRLVRQIAKGWLPFYPEGSNNFVDVRDVCRGMLLAVEKGRRGERYILGGENLTYQEFFRIVAECAGKRALHFRLPRIVARGAGLLGDLYGRLMNRETDLNNQTAALGYLNHKFRSDKAERELGYCWGPIKNAIESALLWFETQTLL